MSAHVAIDLMTVATANSASLVLGIPGPVGAQGAAAWLDVRTFGASVGTGGDDSAAIKAAVEYSNSLAAANKLPPPIYFPAGIYNISANTIPPFVKGGGVIGDGAERTWIKVSPSYVGDVFSWTESWWGSDFPQDGPTPPNLSATKLGPRVVGISLVADLTASTIQNGLVLYDRCSKAFFDDIMLFYFTGRGLYIGKGKFVVSGGVPIRGQATESYFNNIFTWGCGKTVPSVEIVSEGTAGHSDVLHFNNLNIFAPQGGGALKLWNASSATGLGALKFFGLRVEGSPVVPPPAGDLLTIGSPSTTGNIASIQIYDFNGVMAPAGYATIRVTADSIANAPYNIHFHGGKIGPCPGRGVVVDYGRNLYFGLGEISTTEPNVTVGANVGGNVVFDGSGAEAGWTYDVATAAAQSQIRRPLRATPFGTQAFSLNMPEYPTPTAAGGNARGSGAVDTQMVRSSATQVASGFFSGIFAGSSNLVSGSNSVALGGSTNILTGLRSASLSGLRGNDRGRYGCVLQSGNFFTGAQGEAQICSFVLQALTAADAVPVRLTGQGTVADGTNVINLTGVSVYSMTIDLLAVNRSNRTNWYAWRMPQSVIQRSTSAASSTVVTAGTPTILSAGTVTGAAVTLTADTTLAGINLQFTPPTGNAVAWGVVARVYTTEVA